MSAELLLDTQIVVWMADDDERWRIAVGAALADPAFTVHVSAISWIEIAVKARLGKLDIAVGPLRRRMLQAGFLELPLTGNHAEQLELLPLHHRDPFDRMLIAQALSDELAIVTDDAAFHQYEELRFHTP